MGGSIGGLIGTAVGGPIGGAIGSGIGGLASSALSGGSQDSGASGIASNSTAAYGQAGQINAQAAYEANKSYQSMLDNTLRQYTNLSLTGQNQYNNLTGTALNNYNNGIVPANLDALMSQYTKLRSDQAPYLNQGQTAVNTLGAMSGTTNIEPNVTNYIQSNPNASQTDIQNFRNNLSGTINTDNMINFYSSPMAQATLGTSANTDQSNPLSTFYNSPAARAMLGTNENTTQQSLQDQFLNSPQYKYNLQQSQNAINASASAGGYLNSPRTAQALQANAAGLASQNFNNYQNQVNSTYGIYQNQLMSSLNNYQSQLNNLSTGGLQTNNQSTSYIPTAAGQYSNVYNNQGNTGMNVATGQGNTAMTTYGNQGNAYMDIGKNQANSQSNSILSAGNAQAQALLGPLASQNQSIATQANTQGNMLGQLPGLVNSFLGSSGGSGGSGGSSGTNSNGFDSNNTFFSF